MLRRLTPMTVAIGLAASSFVGAADAAPATAAHPQKISFGKTTCAPGWHLPNPGKGRHFLVVNKSARPANIYFLNAINNKVLARIHHLPAHSSQPLTIRIQPRRTYMWGCDLVGGVRRTSDAQQASGEPVGGPISSQVPPVEVESITPALRVYRRYVAGQIKTLVQQISTLQTDLAILDKNDAENAWLAAHETWLKIGQDDAQYSAFGALGLRIDGTAAGLKAGTADPKFTGFHKVELDIWGRGDLTTAATDTHTLAGYVKTLSKTSLGKAMPGNKDGTSTWILRAHEVTEDMVRDTLSGNDDYGSGTGLASVTADVSATREILGLLAPLINPRAPHLVPRAKAQLARLMTLAHSADHNGAWTGVAELSRSARERVDAAADAADETLAPVPDLLRITGT